MKKEILQDIIQMLRMRRDRALLNSKNRGPNDKWTDYWIGVSMGYESSMNLIKEYLNDMEKGGDI